VRPRRPRFSHEGRIFLYTLVSGAPAVLTAIVLLWSGNYSSKVEWTFTVVAVGAWVGFAAAVRERVMRPLQTLANLLAALREDDFSVRGRAERTDDSLGAAMAEVNALGQTLRVQRMGAIDASNLLAKVMAAIDVAIIGFDDEKRVRILNRASERLLGGRLIGAAAEELGLGDVLGGEVPRIVEFDRRGEKRQHLLRRAEARIGGRPHTLIVLTDVQRALRQEEQSAWQRLVRVLGHEINNSLTPIQSIAGSLQAALGPNPDPDVARGLAVIERRAEALGRFMGAYARLAGLPRPKLGPLDVGAWVRRTVELEKRVRIEVVSGPAVTVAADGDQLDQVLINLLRNAAEATQESGGGAVVVSWEVLDNHVDILIDDEGPGIAQTANLFVPFFTTKPSGSGIGLVLSRQITEGHGGRLTLEGRGEKRGCRARIRLVR
jgi:two-component system, NtrC family, nitrogen regulation sensor histidine kinase NtrY